MQPTPICLPVSYEQLKVVYSTGTGVQWALQDVSFTLHPGDWLAIIGRNGSGKSTLAKIIAGLLPSSGGRIVSAENSAHSGYKVRMIGQHPDAQIIGETVYEDLCFGLENECVPAHLMREKASQALALVGLENRIDQAVNELSGGQKQLLAIASALVVEADLLLFDEATSMLDPTARQQLLAVTRRLHDKGTTIVWITQYMEEVVEADRVIALEQGSSIFDGSPELFFYGESLLEKIQPLSGQTNKHPFIANRGEVAQSPDLDGESSAVSVCDQLGMQLPYAVAVGRALLAQGVTFTKLPLTIEDISKEIKHYAVERS